MEKADYSELQGKKLLVVGSEETDSCIVRTAQSMGIYVIAVDGTKTSLKTKAKLAADESWDIDYREKETIAQKCREAHVDGVIAGYSENRVLAACRIAKAIGTPFYASEEQIEFTRNKRKFKEACSRNGVCVPREYCVNGVPDDKEIDGVALPVIIKPSDSAGRKGITICWKREEVASAVKRAMDASMTGTIVMEEYVEGIEFCAVYSLQDGHYSLSYFCDKYVNQALPKSGLCDLSFSPSRYLPKYLESCDQPLRRMMKELEMNDGVAYYQGIINNDGCWVFEMGYRLNGGNDCVQIEKVNGVNYMKMLISHSLTGRMIGDLKLDNPMPSRCFGVLSLYANGGEVKNISYTGEANHGGVEDVGIYKVQGSVIKADGSTLQLAFRFKLSAGTPKELADLIEYVQEHAIIVDVEGKDMILCRFDVNRLLNRQRVL